MNRENETRKVSKSTAKRLPGYLRILKKLIDGNEFRVSSTHLASLLGASPSQVRQDLSSLGEFGLRGYGYDARVLYTSILDIAGVREEYSDVKLTLYGPFEAPVYKIKERYRVQTVIKCRSDKRSRALFSKIYAECEKKFGKKIQTTFDMNPNIV